MSAAASQQQVEPVPRHYGVGKRRLVDFSIEFIKYFVLIPLTFSFAFPLYWMVSSALKVDSQVFTVPPILVPIPAHPENFVNAWQILPFTRYAVNSVFLYTGPVVLFTLLSSTIVAYGFSRIRWPGRDTLFWVVVMTMMLPWAVTMVPLFITYKALGWLDTYRPLVVPALFGHPYMIFLLRQFFLTLPEELLRCRPHRRRQRIRYSLPHHLAADQACPRCSRALPLSLGLERLSRSADLPARRGSLPPGAGNRDPQ